MKRLATSLIVTTCLFGGTSEAGREAARRIDAGELGDRWPLTVGGGEIACIRGPEVSAGRADVVVFRSNGTSYALNLAAKRNGHPEIDAIWKVDPTKPRRGVDLTPLIHLALKQCR